MASVFLQKGEVVIFQKELDDLRTRVASMTAESLSEEEKTLAEKVKDLF